MNLIKRKTKSVLACSLAALTAATAVVPAFAASNSTGSSAADVEEGQLTGVDPNYTPEKNSEYKEANEGTHAADVYVSQGSTYTVTLPKTIVLDGTAAVSNKGAYKVSIDGDISGDEIINVTPKSNNKHINSSHTGDTTTENGTTCANITDENAQFYLGQKYKDDILANVSQNKTVFTTADLQSKDSETPTNTTTGEISVSKLTAGSWKGNFYFNINKDKKVIPDGYTVLYKYNLSATTADNVAAYYCVPKENTEEIEIPNETSEQTKNSITSMVSSLNLFKPIIAYAADNNVVESNGVKYTLSDEDTLVISGSGKMKENIQAEICNYKGLQNAVSEHFGIESVYDGHKPHNKLEYICWIDDSDLYFEYVKNGIVDTSRNKEITEYICSIKNNYIMTSPKTVIIQDGVTNISKNAFYNSNLLTNIIIPDSVTSIEDSAFFGCNNLTNIAIPDSVTSIGINTFGSCSSLTNITIPNSVTSIGDSAFSFCDNLTNINISNSITSIGYQTFFFCKMTSINIPDSVTSIGREAFAHCDNLTNVTIPNSVTSIEYQAFKDCPSLINITIPDSVTSIGENAFYLIPIVHYKGSATGSPWGAFSINGYLDKDLIYKNSNKKEIERYIGKSTNVVIPNGVTSIEDSAFGACSNLTNITIPNSVISIGPRAFASCSNLTSIVIPNGVTSIKEYTFSNCEKLANIIIPDSVTSIGDYAFYGCSNLTNVIIPNNVTLIGEQAFYYCTGLRSIVIPNNVTSIGYSAFYNCDNLTNVIIPNSVISIGRRAFYNLKSDSTIYCQSQDVANLLISGKNYNSSKTTVVVDASKF